MFGVIITLFMYDCIRTLLYNRADIGYLLLSCRIFAPICFNQQAIITTFAVFRRAWCATLCNEIHFVFVVFRVLIQEGSITRKRKKQIKFSISPPPQTKTLKTKRVFVYRMLRFCSRYGSSGKLCSEFKFSYIGWAGNTKTFARWWVFYIWGDFSIMYIYASRNRVSDRELVGGLVYLRRN